MNEEIRESAKFFLKQYAEKVSDKLISSQHFLTEQKRILASLGPNGDAWYQNLLQERIDKWESLIPNQVTKLRNIDNVIAAL